jgi:hypothetical protein
LGQSRPELSCKSVSYQSSSLRWSLNAHVVRHQGPALPCAWRLVIR